MTSIPLDSAFDERRAWDFLCQHLPISLAVREIMRLRCLSALKELQKPILDVGCGDGLFWENIIRDMNHGDRELLNGLLGIDINANELALASARLKNLGAEILEFDITASNEGVTGKKSWEGSFATVIANCSLEHVPDIELAIGNIYKNLEKNGIFILFVPAPGWTSSLATKRFFGMFSGRIAGLFGGALDGFFQHHHIYPSKVWEFLLSGFGFSEIKMMSVGSVSGNKLFERFLPTAFVAFIWKLIAKRYPQRILGSTASRLVEEFLSDVRTQAVVSTDLKRSETIEYFIVCRK